MLLKQKVKCKEMCATMLDLQSIEVKDYGCIQWDCHTGNQLQEIPWDACDRAIAGADTQIIENYVLCFCYISFYLCVLEKVYIPITKFLEH